MKRKCEVVDLSVEDAAHQFQKSIRPRSTHLININNARETFKVTPSVVFEAKDCTICGNSGHTKLQCSVGLSEYTNLRHQKRIAASSSPNQQSQKRPEIFFEVPQYHYPHLSSSLLSLLALPHNATINGPYGILLYLAGIEGEWAKSHRAKLFFAKKLQNEVLVCVLIHITYQTDTWTCFTHLLLWPSVQ